jgi:hypothetical protein
MDGWMDGGWVVWAARCAAGDENVIHEMMYDVCDAVQTGQRAKPENSKATMQEE